MIKEVKNEVVSRIAACDKCGTVTKPHCKCAGCGIHLCRAHTKFLDIDPWTNSMAGDYPERTCQACFDRLGEFEKRASEILERAHQEASELRDLWVAACLRAKAGDA